MRFQTGILIVLTGLVALVVASVLIGITLVADQAAHQALNEELLRARHVGDTAWGLRQSLFDAQAQRLADAPRLRAVTATGDIDHATIIDVVGQVQTAEGAEILLLVDGEGTLLADAGHPDEHGHSLAHLPAVDIALREGSTGAIWMSEHGQAHQVASHRVAFGETTVGAVIVGHALDDDLAAALHRQTGAAILFSVDGVVVARFLGPDFHVSDDVLGGMLADLGEPTEGPAEVSLGGERGVAIVYPLPQSDEERHAQLILVRSLDRALRPNRRLKSIAWSSGAAALLIAFVISILLSRAVSRPLKKLANVAGLLAKDHLDARVEPDGLYETEALGHAINDMADEIQESREQLRTTQRLEREMEIAMELQTAMLPSEIAAVDDLIVSARMIPATEVGGDYYDVICADDGHYWIGIADVAGHGLAAGIVMQMLQTCVATLVASPGGAADPAGLVVHVNRVLYKNVRDRLQTSEHITFVIFKYVGGGRFLYAGAHEDFLVFRSATQRCERMPTRGTWLAVAEDIQQVTEETKLQLEPGDAVILLTDGVLEAENTSREQFGMKRVKDVVAALTDRERSKPELVRDAILEAVQKWAPVPDDDMTVLVIRYEPR